MNDTVRLLLTAFASGVALLTAIGLGIIARRWYVSVQAQRHAMHVRLIRSELMQAVARGEDGFLIQHWTRRDRRAAFEVASQILGFLRGPDRRRLENIVERNSVLAGPLARVARMRESRRVATIRLLAAFGNDCVQGCLHALLRFDPSPRVRLEAAIAILVAGTLPSPWRIVRSVLADKQVPTPNHRLLFRTLALERVEAVIAMATLQEDPSIRLLAIDALGHADDPRAANVLSNMQTDANASVAQAAREALVVNGGPQTPVSRSDHAAAKIRRVAAARLAA